MIRLRPTKRLMKREKEKKKKYAIVMSVKIIKFSCPALHFISGTARIQILVFKVLH